MQKLSIIIPVYNVENYISKCLDSIVVDNYFKGEIICVNDGSTDNTLSLLEKYSMKYSNLQIISQANKGLSEARNTGLRVATGEYVFFLDSDDWILPNSLDRIIQQLNGEDILYFNSKIYLEDQQCFSTGIDIQNLKNMSGSSYLTTIYDKPRNMPYVCVCGGVYSRSFLLKHNLYNEPGIYHEDNYFTPQVLLAAQNVSSINEYVYVYRIRKGSITATVTHKHIKDLLYVARNLYDKYETIGNVADVFYRDIHHIYSNLINAAYNYAISVNRKWCRKDSRQMLRCAYDARSRKIAKLSFLSLSIAYRYMNDKLPHGLRRIINRFL